MISTLTSEELLTVLTEVGIDVVLIQIADENAVIYWASSILLWLFGELH